MIRSAPVMLMLALNGSCLGLGQGPDEDPGSNPANPAGSAGPGKDAEPPSGDVTVHALDTRIASALKPVNWSAFPKGHIHIQPNSEWSNISGIHQIFRRQYMTHDTNFDVAACRSGCGQACRCSCNGCGWYQCGCCRTARNVVAGCPTCIEACNVEAQCFACYQAGQKCLVTPVVPRLRAPYQSSEAATAVCVTSSPTSPTRSPTAAPSVSPNGPTAAPTPVPTGAPSSAPSSAPSTAPLAALSSAPSAAPSSAPSSAPSVTPTTSGPTDAPTHSPTTASPTVSPSSAPTTSPTVDPCGAYTCSDNCEWRNISTDGSEQERCGWDGAAGRCRTGAVTTQAEAAARLEFGPGGCGALAAANDSDEASGDLDATVVGLAAALAVAIAVIAVLLLRRATDAAPAKPLNTRSVMQNPVYSQFDTPATAAPNQPAAAPSDYQEPAAVSPQSGGPLYSDVAPFDAADEENLFSCL